MAAQYPTDVIEQAKSVAEAWNTIDPAMKVGTNDKMFDLPALRSDVAQSDTVTKTFDTLDAQVTALRNQRDTLYAELWDKVKRLRSAVKGNYGDDSSEYEMVGGTRKSERKSTKHKNGKPAQ